MIVQWAPKKLKPVKTLAWILSHGSGSDRENMRQQLKENLRVAAEPKEWADARAVEEKSVLAQSCCWGTLMNGVDLYVVQVSNRKNKVAMQAELYGLHRNVRTVSELGLSPLPYSTVHSYYIYMRPRFLQSDKFVCPWFCCVASALTWFVCPLTLGKQVAAFTPSTIGLEEQIQHQSDACTLTSRASQYQRIH
jgi:hypothetical protein